MRRIISIEIVTLLLFLYINIYLLDTWIMVQQYDIALIVFTVNEMCQYGILLWFQDPEINSLNTWITVQQYDIILTVFTVDGMCQYDILLWFQDLEI